MAHEFILSNPGLRPPYWAVAEHVWGAGCDFDSDGDSSVPDASDWTELTVILRSDECQRIDIDPVEAAEPFTLRIRSEDEQLAKKAAEFLAVRSGGELRRTRS